MKTREVVLPNGQLALEIMQIEEDIAPDPMDRTTIIVDLVPDIY